VQVRAIITAAYKDGIEFGELVELIVVTGAGPNQVARLHGSDAHANRKDPRIMMPSSKKGTEEDPLAAVNSDGIGQVAELNGKSRTQQPTKKYRGSSRLHLFDK
jgi:hypothetical protein